jgi:hypothetical protein
MPKKNENMSEDNLLKPGEEEEKATKELLIYTQIKKLILKKSLIK